MTLLVFGATGVVGRAVVEVAIRDSRFEPIIAVSRRPLIRSHPRLHLLVHQDFRNLDLLAGALSGVDACVYALGMAWPRAASEAQYREVTRDYAVAAARVLHAANARARFCFVSGHGAGRGSRQTWARIKAEAEDDVVRIAGAGARILRPGYIYPVEGRESPYWGDAVMRPFMPFRRVLGKYITDSTTVARALLHAALGGDVPSPAANADIGRAAEAYARAVRRSATAGA
jgi:uncharacterized protein YbjT (DUF2867 family)